MKLKEKLIKTPLFGTPLILIHKVLKRIMNENLSFLAGGVAFYSLLSVFPAMTALISLYGLIADVNDVYSQLENVERFFPTDAYIILSEQLSDIAMQSDQSLSIAMIIGLLITFFSAARGIKAMVAAMNMIYKVRETRKWLKRNAIAYVLTIGAISSMAAAIFTIVAIPLLIKLMNLPEFITDQINYARWFILGSVIWLGLVLLFRYGPSRKAKRWISMMIGAGCSTILWIIMSIGFSKFVEIFPSFNNIYGSLSAIVILMFWFFLTAYAILAGVSINAVLEDYLDI